MAALLFYALIAVNAVVAIAYPWIGVAVTYFVTLLAPQDIWWWTLSDARLALWAVLPTLAGFALATMQHRADFKFFKSRLNACVLILWLCFTVSYYFGPYVDVVNRYRFYDIDSVFSTLQKTYLLYFVAVALIDETRKLKVMALVFVVTVLYMTYWANSQYFFHGKFGRLAGPAGIDGGGIYADENCFAVLFVVGFPFLYYLSAYVKSRTLRWTLWAVIPFTWHAVFLSASRGALLGVGIVLLLFAVRAQRKVTGLVVIAAFAAAFVWQAGDVMKSRTATITEYETEGSATGRLDAWEAATRMMLEHPFTGVGFASFGQAYPDFSDTKPRIAHNTFFQIGADWGLVAGIAYLVLFVSTIQRLWRNGTHLRTGPMTEDRRALHLVNEACLFGLTGFFVCSMFLSLQGYEILYFLLILANATLLLSKRQTESVNAPQHAPQQIRRTFGGVRAAHGPPTATRTSGTA